MPHVRLSVRGPIMTYFECFYLTSQQPSLLVTVRKSMVGFARLFQPTYAEANVGHPSTSLRLRFDYTACNA